MAAERAGFDDVWFAEHHFMSYGVCPSAVTLAAYVLGQTGRIRVGTAVSVLSVHHPVALAEQAALLDQVSGGRFWLGVGRGGPWVDLEVFGTGLGRYQTGFAEALDLLIAAMTRDRVRGAGPEFTFGEVPVVPRPRTPPAPAAGGGVHLTGFGGAGRRPRPADAGGLAVGAERLGQVLVDVGVDGYHRPPAGGQMPNEQRRQRGLPAAALARERDLHSSSTSLSLSVPVMTRGAHHIEMVFIFSKNERDSNRTVTERTSRCR